MRIQKYYKTIIFHFGVINMIDNAKEYPTHLIMEFELYKASIEQNTYPESRIFFEGD